MHRNHDDESEKSAFQALQSLQTLPPLCGCQALKIIEFFPFPIQIFAPDGTVITTNRAFLDLFKIVSRNPINGKYNILNDPAIETWGIKEYVSRAFQGEFVQILDIKVPVKDLTSRFSTKDLQFENIFQNIICFPIPSDSNQLLCVGVLFITSRAYRQREEIMKSKEYIESHWLEEFDIDKIASAANLSKYHFSRLFKKHTGMTPYVYYWDIKIGKLKERLRDLNLSISQVFADCGLHYSGNLAKMFKERVGISPSQYRALS